MPLPAGQAPLRENQFYRAYGSRSRFLFVGDAGCPVRLRLTCRLPAAAPPHASILLAVNGQAQARFAIGHGWETWELAIPRGTVQDGVNEVSIHWPPPEFPGQQGLEAAADELVDGTLPDLFPCYGEIHAFTAAAGTAED